jgi:hypothetical protein
MRQTKRDRTSVINTIRNWGSGDFKIPLLNRIWKLLPGFIVWQLWKERNSTHLPLPDLHSLHNLDPIVESIWETIQIQSWTPEDIPSEPPESIIFSSWKKITSKASLSFSAPPTPTTRSPSSWSCPPPGFWKLNFDGASKGNPGPTGFGAVIRDNTGKI